MRPTANRPGPPEPFLADLAVEYRPISSLKPRAHNPRRHSKRQVRQIAGSIRTFGFTNPVLIDDMDAILAGHGRVEAAKLLGHKTVPTIRLSAMTEAQKRAYVIADNKLALNAGWDERLLALELQYLSELELDFDIGVIGFEDAEFDLLVTGLDADDTDAADLAPEIDPAAPEVSRPGDLWQIASHRLLCADATKSESFTRLMAGDRAQMVFTDPPYNVPIDGHACGSGQIRHREFAMAAGEMSPNQFMAFLETVIGHLVAHSGDGAIHFVCMDWRHIRELLWATHEHYTELKNLVVWNKTNAGMGSLYRSKHELVFVFKSGTAPHINNVELGRHGRYRTNVWDYPGVNTLKPGRREELAMHPTVKPVALVADAIRDCSRRGGIVLDPFAGSGTTLLAAECTRRIAYAIELDPHYVDIAIQRLQRASGEPAVHVASGLTFQALGDKRFSDCSLHSDDGVRS